jgi:phospholipase D1/2
MSISGRTRTPNHRQSHERLVKKKLTASQIIRLGIVPIVMIGLTFTAWKLGYFELDRRREVGQLVQGMRGIPGMVFLYLAGYAIAVAICLPVVVMTILGGAFFGPVFGPMFAWSGALIGTALTHTLASRIARAPLRRMFGEHKLLKQLRNDVSVVGLFSIRIVPIAPFGVFAYVSGLAGVKLWRLLVATALAMIPSATAYGYVGAELMRGLTTDPEAAGRALRVAGYVTIGMFLLSIIPNIVRRIRGSES